MIHQAFLDAEQGKWSTRYAHTRVVTFGLLQLLMVIILARGLAVVRETIGEFSEPEAYNNISISYILGARDVSMQFRALSPEGAIFVIGITTIANYTYDGIIIILL